MSAAKAPRPVCRMCGRRIERIGMNDWAHLQTVAGLDADKDHAAVPKGVTR